MDMDFNNWLALGHSQATSGTCIGEKLTRRTDWTSYITLPDSKLSVTKVRALKKGIYYFGTNIAAFFKNLGPDSNSVQYLKRNPFWVLLIVWATVRIGTWSLSAPGVNSIANDQPWKKKPAVGSRPGSALTFQNLHLTSTLLGQLYNQVVYWLSVSSGRWGWTQVGIPQQAFFQGWWTKRSGPYPYCCWTLATGHRPWLHCHWFVVVSSSMR